MQDYCCTVARTYTRSRSSENGSFEAGGESREGSCNRFLLTPAKEGMEQRTGTMKKKRKGALGFSRMHR